MQEYRVCVCFFILFIRMYSGATHCGRSLLCISLVSAGKKQKEKQLAAERLRESQLTR